jgi:hypothetical protein
MVAHGEGGFPMTSSDVETDLKLITLHAFNLGVVLYTMQHL